jgi:hypothetical protein
LSVAAPVKEANRFLDETYLPQMNGKFSRPAAEAADAHVPWGTVDLKDILCFEHERTVTYDYIIRFHARLFQMLPEAKIKPRPGDSVIVRTKLDNSIVINGKDKPLLVKEVNSLFDEYQ